MKTYSEKLLHPKWQRKRLDVLNRDNFTCQCCGDKETTLNIHHLEYKGDPWDIANYFLITVCAVCHVDIEETKFDDCDEYVKRLIKIQFDNHGRAKG